jgi:caffeoyl-CoA O-methyltransferase
LATVSEPKSFLLTSELHEYLVGHVAPLDDVARGLMERTAELGAISIMQVAPEQAALLTLLTRLIGARTAVEVGTFTGFSALAIARGLVDGGTLLCCDVSEDWTSVGRPFWDEAGVADRIDLRIAPGAVTLAALDDERTIDLAFIDADKPNYPVYWDLLVPRMRPGGLVLVDNVLWSGKVIDPSVTDDDTLAIRAFNDKVAADERVESVILTVADGLTLARVR